MKKQLINKNLQSYKQLRRLNRKEFNRTVLRPIVKSAFLGAVLGGLLVIFIVTITLIDGMRWNLSNNEINQLGYSIVNWIEILLGVLTAGIFGVYILSYKGKYFRWSRNDKEFNYQITIAKMISFVFIPFLTVSLAFL